MVEEMNIENPPWEFIFIFHNPFLNNFEIKWNKTPIMSRKNCFKVAGFNKNTNVFCQVPLLL